jgi:AcrR family transcriptional regulator
MMAGDDVDATAPEAPAEPGGLPPRGRRGRRVLVRPRKGAETDGTGTRERILEVALDLFIEQGFEKTSLREIAERVGVTKAALYYHFESKDEILLALHLPMHDLVGRMAAQLSDNPSSASWVTFLDWVIDELAAHHRYFLLYQRNAAVFREIEFKGHDQPDRMEPEQLIGRMLGDAALSLDDRVRRAGSLTMVVAGWALTMRPGSPEPDPAELATALRSAVRDLLRASPTPS